MIQIVLTDDKVRNGERLKGNVTWRAEGSKQPRKIEVACRWRIEGRGKEREEVVGSADMSDVGGRTEVSIPFEFDIPLYGPLSYDGKLLRIIWEVAADVDLPMARDEHDVKVFTVLPRKWDPAEWEEGEGHDDEMTDDSG